MSVLRQWLLFSLPFLYCYSSFIQNVIFHCSNYSSFFFHRLYLIFKQYFAHSSVISHLPTRHPSYNLQVYTLASHFISQTSHKAEYPEVRCFLLTSMGPWNSQVGMTLTTKRGNDVLNFKRRMISETWVEKDRKHNSGMTWETHLGRTVAGFPTGPTGVCLF